MLIIHVGGFCHQQSNGTFRLWITTLLLDTLDVPVNTGLFEEIMIISNIYIESDIA